uniref:Phosphate-specific transport system accessory protein PhoU n=1 Tax=candidate division WOR-3 bacterium TaxID=2052148 RepID=A0A7V0Z5H5_UNCW3
MLKEKTEKLKINIIKFASIVENMLKDAETSVYTRDHAIANNVITHLEQLANRIEIENETQFIEFLALFQPEASDLRTVVSLLKINNNLERIADHCVNIAQRISSFNSINNFIKLKVMFSTVQQMFKETFSAFINNGTGKLLKIIEQDKIVDEKLRELTNEVIDTMDNCHTMSNNAISALLIGRDLERIGDLTINICEDIIYMTKGDVIKHRWYITSESSS